MLAVSCSPKVLNILDTSLYIESFNEISIDLMVAAEARESAAGNSSIGELDCGKGRVLYRK